jgi:ring-1,2-phenylacetyl-CoA epoxidase subunit PaaB
MSYDVPRAEGEVDPTFGTAGSRVAGYPLWEVFIRPKRGLSHVHAGSLHAADAGSAVLAARDVYTRRSEGVSIWVVPSAAITASDPDEADAFFDSDKPYRHPTFYPIPDGVGHM